MSSDSDTSRRSEDYDDRTEIHKRLAGRLDNVTGSGLFACTYQETRFPLPGIVIEDFGILGLPLSEREAEALINICHKSPFGKGQRTIVDEAFRKTWEIDAAQFKIASHDWCGPFMTQMLNAIRVDFGISEMQSIQAKRYKLLLYEKGAMFKPHRDTEKIPGMFGTLVICLPTAHEGGELHLTLNKKTVVFETSSSSDYGLSIGAWYSDVLHEVKPVTEGHRLVITYNLVMDPEMRELNPQPSVADIDEAKNELLQKADLQARASIQREIPLLRDQSIKGSDLQRARALEYAVASSPYLVSVHLANISRSHSGNEDEDFEDYHISPIEITSLRQLDGLDAPLWGREGYCQKDWFVQHSPYADREPTHRLEEETRNEGMAIEYQYQDTVFLLEIKGSKPVLTSNQLKRKAIEAAEEDLGEEDELA